MNKLIPFLVCVGLSMLTPITFAAPPQTISYAGYLTNPGGTPINNAVVMTFRIYNAAMGGSAIYAETQLSVAVSNGNFNALIGSVTPIPLPFDQPYWLGLTINADAEMVPRQQLASTPYAFRASSLDSVATVAGAQVSGSISNATLPTTNLSGTISSAQIANGTVTQSKLSPVSGAAAGKVLGTDGANLQWQTAGVGTVTNIATGSGLSGGPITGSGTIGLAATQLLPTVQCAINQIPKWDGAAWTCAADDTSAAGGNLTLVNPSTATTGNILKGATRFIHNFGSGTYIGEGAGNFTMTGANNVAIGGNTLASNTTGTSNTASGLNALFSNTSGNHNTASGTFALLFNSSGSMNTALGRSALQTNSTASGNTAVGFDALLSNTTGSGNTANGASALAANTTGILNSASGENALLGNTIGNGNSAFGVSALQTNTTGFYNTAIGSYALTGNTTGYLNTATGRRALELNTTGLYNTAIGHSALASNTTGSQNIALGFGAGFYATGDNNIDIGSDGATGDSGIIRIGTTGSQFLTYIAGIYNAPALISGATVYVEPDGRLGTNPSSRRFKDDITDMNAASSALMNLRPVTFHYKTDQHPSGRTLQYGLIAEEVAEVYPGLVIHSADGEIDAVAYQHLPPMLLNEFQKQQRTIAAQAVELAQQRTKTDMLERKLLNIEALLAGR